MTCGRCGLSLRERHAEPPVARLRLDRCPRCFAFAGVSVPLHSAGLSLVQGEAAEQRSPVMAPRRPSPFGHLVVYTEQFGDGILITLHGKLDLASEGCFDRALARAWEIGCPRIVIDLGELEFLDAAGLKALLRVREHTLEGGRELVLMRGPPNVHRMFELTGTTDLFTFHD